MKPTHFIASIIILVFLQMQITIAQTNKVVKLPAPDRSGGKALMLCLNERQSSRDFKDENISLQHISNLLWAANGINREDISKHTAPTAMNRQNMEVYILLPDGAWLYNDTNNTLELIESGNHMEKAGTQEFAHKSPANIVIVSDMAKLGDGSAEKTHLYAGIHAGAIMQNIYLYCSSAGLKTVTRASFDESSLASLLKLTSNKKIILAQTVGY